MFWELTDLDVTGATLIDFDVQGCQFGHATFTGAHFEGVARFSGAQFNGRAVFDTATFTSDAWFRGTQFDQRKSGGTQFNATKFQGDAVFIGAVFKDAAVFHESWFTGAAEFMGVQVAGTAMFMRAYFGGRVAFSRAKLAERADFWMPRWTSTATTTRSHVRGPQAGSSNSRRKTAISVGWSASARTSGRRVLTRVVHIGIAAGATLGVVPRRSGRCGVQSQRQSHSSAFAAVRRAPQRRADQNRRSTRLSADA
jgi:uncharacterized protein YjbI with pentapeptide repeats